MRKPFSRALVTGATGYLGSRLLARLAAEGLATHAVVRGSSDLSRLRAASPKTSVHVHDGTATGMLSILESARPEVVFHLAALASDRHAPEDLDALVRSNLLFGLQAAEAASRSGVGAFINTGTYWQHYRGREYDPVSLYAAAKQAFEDFLRYYSAAAGLRVLTLKLFDVYGPEDPRPKLLNLLVQAQRTEMTLDLSPGGQTIDLVHVDDVVEAYRAAAALALRRAPRPGAAYAVGGGRRMRVRDVVRLFERVSGKKAPVRFGERPYRPREVIRPWDGPRLPGWRPRVRLEEGIRAMLGRS